MVLSFDGYSFCKAHSASYAMVSYRIAYLKQRHPLQFISSVINNGGGYYTRQTYLNEARRMGFCVLQPDINKSMLPYTVEHGRLRTGLCQLREIHRDTVLRILEDRQRRGPFLSYRDVFNRLSPSHSDASVLIRSGCLDSVSEGTTRPQLMWEHSTRNHGLFSMVDDATPTSTVVGDYSRQLKDMYEYQTLGLFVTEHPVNMLRERIKRIASVEGFVNPIGSSDIPLFSGKRVTTAGTIAAGKEVVTRRSEIMLFVSFEDEQSIYETVFFPGALRKYVYLLDGRGVFLVSGIVEEELGVFSINVERLRKINRNERE